MVLVQEVWGEDTTSLQLFWILHSGHCIILQCDDLVQNISYFSIDGYVQNTNTKSVQYSDFNPKTLMQSTFWKSQARVCVFVFVFVSLETIAWRQELAINYLWPAKTAISPNFLPA